MYIQLMYLYILYIILYTNIRDDITYRIPFPSSAGRLKAPQAWLDKRFGALKLKDKRPELPSHLRLTVERLSQQGQYMAARGGT